MTYYSPDNRVSDDEFVQLVNRAKDFIGRGERLAAFLNETDLMPWMFAFDADDPKNEHGGEFEPQEVKQIKNVLRAAWDAAKSDR